MWATRAASGNICPVPMPRLQRQAGAVCPRRCVRPDRVTRTQPSGQRVQVSGGCGRTRVARTDSWVRASRTHDCRSARSPSTTVRWRSLGRIRFSQCTTSSDRRSGFALCSGVTGQILTPATGCSAEPGPSRSCSAVAPTRSRLPTWATIAMSRTSRSIRSMPSTHEQSQPEPRLASHRPMNRGTDARCRFDRPKDTVSCLAKQSDFTWYVPLPDTELSISRTSMRRRPEQNVAPNARRTCRRRGSEPVPGASQTLPEAALASECATRG